MFGVQITKADIEASKDGKTLTAFVEGNFLPVSERQHNLLNFIFNDEGNDSEVSLGALENGHDGFRFSVSVESAKFFQAMHVKDLRVAIKQQLFEQTGAQPADADVEKLVQQELNREAEANLAKQVDEASKAPAAPLTPASNASNAPASEASKSSGGQNDGSKSSSTGSASKPEDPSKGSGK